jgi:SAM-dependent methyltransferase
MHWCAGEAIPGLSAGLFRKLEKDYYTHCPFDRAISVGCGNGAKEIEMIERGLVNSFDLYDIADGAIESGIADVKRRGLDDKIRFFSSNALESALSREYDLVTWFSSLHHMPSSRDAIKWSKDVLRRGGILIFDEYVGESRFQFSELFLKVNSDYRRTLPCKYLQNPFKPGSLVDTLMVNIDIDDLILLDPSEAVDSGDILPAMKEYFSSAEIILTGGAIYHMALNDIIHNLQNDSLAIENALELDLECIHNGLNQFAVAIAVK